MSKKHLYILTALLAAVGILVFSYKHLVLDLPLTPDAKAESWEIEMRIAFQASGDPVKVTLFTPRNTDRYTVFDQQYVSPGYGLTTESDGTNRKATLSTRKADGRQVIYYRIVLLRSKLDGQQQKSTPAQRVTTKYTGADLAAAQAIATSARRRSADTVTLAAQILERLSSKTPSDAAKLLMGTDPPPSRIAEAAVQILAIDNVSARAVHGIHLKDVERRARLVHWLEVYVDGRWIALSPQTATVGVPEDYFALWRGPGRLVSVTGGKNVEVRLSQAQIEEGALQRALALGKASKDDLIGFSMFSLPISTQQVYKLLLVIPIGIFILVILRNVVGVKTFGTFMPVLMALAFRQTHLVWGIVLFTTIIGFGLLIRFYMEQLKLLLVPRLAAVLICVVLLMAVVSVLSHKLGFDRGLSVALFPMVIITMTIERMSIVWDERGPLEAFKQAIGSLVVAAICYAVMSIGLLQHALYVFPELLLVLLAATMLLGRYAGYRLVEIPRFRVLAEGKR